MVALSLCYVLDAIMGRLIAITWSLFSLSGSPSGVNLTHCPAGAPPPPSLSPKGRGRAPSMIPHQHLKSTSKIDNSSVHTTHPKHAV